MVCGTLPGQVADRDGAGVAGAVGSPTGLCIDEHVIEPEDAVKQLVVGLVALLPFEVAIAVAAFQLSIAQISLGVPLPKDCSAMLFEVKNECETYLSERSLRGSVLNGGDLLDRLLLELHEGWRSHPRLHADHVGDAIIYH